MASSSNHKSIIPPKVKCAFKPTNPRMRGSKKVKRFRFGNLPQEESQHFSSSSGSEIKRDEDPFEYEAYSPQSVGYAHSPDHSGYVTYVSECCELDDDAGSFLPEPRQEYQHDESCHDHDCESSQLDGNHDEFCHFDDDLEDDDCKPEYHEVIYPEPEEDNYGEPYFPEPEQEYDYFSSSSGSEIKRDDDPFEHEAYSPQSVGYAHSPDHSGYVTCEPECCELDDDAGSYLPEPQQECQHDESCHDHNCESSQLKGDHEEFCHFDDDLEDHYCKPEYHEVIYPELVEDDYGEPYFPEPEQEYDYFYGSQVKPFHSRCNADDASASVDSISDSYSSHESELEHKTYDDKASFCSVSSPDQPLSPPRPAEYFDCKLCVKMAREPVVTQCGHLFCGDCLNKWLFFFTSEMQCPVCRSKVLDDSIIQISPPPWWQQRP